MEILLKTTDKYKYLQWNPSYPTSDYPVSALFGRFWEVKNNIFPTAPRLQTTRDRSHASASALLYK